MKTGVKSSEFYVTLGSAVVSLLVMSGLIAPESASETQEVIVQAIGGIVALGSIISYIYSRTVLKQEGMKSQVKG